MHPVKVCPVCSREFDRTSASCPHDGAQLVDLNTGATSKPEDLLGHVVDGRYRIEQIIGKGGMGTVYSVRHVVVGKPAAMKVLRNGVDRSEGVLQRFIREAQAANAVNNRHIVQMSDFGQLPNGSFYMVMELLEGEPFGTRLKRADLSRSQLIHIFTQMADALEAAHAVGVIHRDLKPDNVFLTREDGDPLYAKLLDFGIAKLVHTEASNLTETGVILGTPYYMSPEQARAEPVDHRTDIYAMGVIMYRAFTGKLPFVADSTMGVLTAHLTETPELPSSISQVDPPVERMILRCLEKQRERRFQSMGELAAVLRQLAMGHEPPTVEDPPGHPAGLPLDPSTGPHAAYQTGAHAYVPPAGGYAPALGQHGSASPAHVPADSGQFPVGGGSGAFAPVGAAPPSSAMPTLAQYGGAGAPMGETGASVVTSNTKAAAPGRSGMLALVGAATMVAVGALAAFVLVGRSSADGKGDASSASGVDVDDESAAADDSPKPQSTSEPSSKPDPSPTSTVDPAPSAQAAPKLGGPWPPATGGGSKPAGTGTGEAVATDTGTGAALPPTPTATTTTSPEIRSPFD